MKDFLNLDLCYAMELMAFLRTEFSLLKVVLVIQCLFERNENTAFY